MLVGTTERTERLIAADAANRQAVVNETAALGEGTYRPRVLIARRNREGGVFWPISWHFLVAKQIPLLGAVDVTLSRPVPGAGLNQEELYVMDPDSSFCRAGAKTVGTRMPIRRISTKTRSCGPWRP